MSGFIWFLVALTLHVWPGAVNPAHAQGSRRDDIVFNTRGVPLAGATVRVCAMPASGQPCTPLALIYSDAGLTQALANPTTTDGLGNYFFYAAPGKYEIEISGPNITTKQIPNVILPSDPSSPTFSSINSSGGINAFSLTLTGNLTVNGSTSVLGNLASGTLTLSNQSTPPGAAGAGTVNLYTKTTDKRLYYKDETGTEVGPIASANGVQANQANTFTAVQNFDADVHPKGPNPWYDITRFGGYVGPNYGLNGANATTCTINASSASASCASASDFTTGNGILILGAGPAPAIATPQAPTVTTYFQTGSTTRNYCVADRDWAGGITPCSAVGSTSTAPASMNLATYSISSWSFNVSTHTFTVTTSAAHNMPITASGISSEPYAQIEIQGGTANNRLCEGAFSLTAVPSATTFQFTRNELNNDPGCSGGTMRIQPRVTLVWDSHFTYSVQSASCSGGAATVTVSPGVYGPANTAASNWVVPFFVNAVFSGISDSHYNGTFQIGSYAPGGSAPNSVQYSIGSCSGVSNLGAGGTMSLVPGKAVKNHLIYECTGSSCALPANAANYSLVGVATGNDGYFQDKGWPISPPFVDAGDVPAAAPTAATNEYLDTTIISGGGTTSLTLANAATSSVTSAKTYHDNVPNLLAACAAIPQSGGQITQGRILIPAPSSPNWNFPIIANFDMYGAFGAPNRNCPGYTTLEFHAPPYLLGTVLVSKGASIIGGPGSTNCSTSFYGASSDMACIFGNSYPLFYFEPETSGGNLFQNVAMFPNGIYQSGIYMDGQLNGDGVVDERYENAHINVNANNHSYPVVDKAGFGRFWNNGGWSGTNGLGNFAEGRDYILTFNCGAPLYQTGTPFYTYIFSTNNTYSFGTFQVDSCGQSHGNFGFSFTNMLTENTAGPAFKFNTSPAGASAVSLNQLAYADGVGAASTPYIDAVNAIIQGLEIDGLSCQNGSQPVLQTGSTQTSYSAIVYNQIPGACPAGIGVTSAAAIEHRNMGALKKSYANWFQGLTGGSYLGANEIPAPTVAPVVTVSTTCTGFPAAGNYSYAYIYADAAATVGNSLHRTMQGPTSNTVALNGSTQCAQISAPSSPPPGAVFYDVIRVSAPLGAGNRLTSASLVPIASTAMDQALAWQGIGAPSTNNAYINNVDQNGVFGTLVPQAITNNTGDQVFNVTLGSSSPGCATAASVGATCTTANLTLPVAEADTNYRIVCTGKGPTGVPVITSSANISSSQFTFTIAALTAAAASFASADCRVGHN